MKKMNKRYPIDLGAVGGRLRAVREELKLSMEQMREISGYSKSLISAAENGLKKPSALYLYAMYDHLNVNIHYIFSGEGDMFLVSKADPGTAADTGSAVGPDTESEVSPDTGPGWAGADDNIRSLFYLMEHVDMVRFAVLSHFIEYRTHHKRMIEELLEEKLDKLEQSRLVQDKKD